MNHGSAAGTPLARQQAAWPPGRPAMSPGSAALAPFAPAERVAAGDRATADQDHARGRERVAGGGRGGPVAGGGAAPARERRDDQRDRRGTASRAVDARVVGAGLDTDG